MPTKFVSAQDGEPILQTDFLLDYKEGDEVSLQEAPVPGIANYTTYVITERLPDQISLYGHSVTREYRVNTLDFVNLLKKRNEEL